MGIPMMQHQTYENNSPGRRQQGSPAVRFMIGNAIILSALLSVFAILWCGIIPVSAKADKPMKKVSIQLRWDHQYQFAGYYAALWQGYYADAGFDVEIRSAVKPDGRILSAIDEVAGGIADYGVGAADILLAAGQGKPLIVVASIFQQSAAAFYARQETPFNSPKDLIGLVVSRTVNDLIDIELQIMLKKEGIDISKIRSIPQSTDLEDFVNHVTDVFSGYIIAEPYQLSQRGIRFKTLRPIDYGIDFYGDSLFTTEMTVKKDPAAVERFRLASIKGWEYALDHPVEIADRITRDLPRTAVIVGGTFSGFNQFLINGVNDLTLYPIVSVGNTNPDRWRHMSTLLQELGILKKPIDMDTFVFDYKGFQKARNDSTIRMLTWLLLILSFISLVGLTWIRIFVLRKEVKRQTAELEKEKTSLEGKRKELEVANEELFSTGKELRENETRLIAAKEAAEAANLSQSQFLSNMSHEIRTPMNGFMGMLQLLEMTTLTEEQKQYITLSRRSSNALLVVINDILDYSKMEAGKIELACIPFSVSDVVQDVMSMFGIAASEKSLGLSSCLEEDIPGILLGDPFRLRQVLSNLMGNAVKFTKDGQIDLYARVCEKPANGIIKLEFNVKDTGIGIPKGKADLLFERFSQVDDSNTRRYGGTGLGLAISKSLVELMNGDIWVESNEGEGCCFHFTCAFGTVGTENESAGKEMTGNMVPEPGNTPAAGNAGQDPMLPVNFHEAGHPGPKTVNLLLADDDETSRILVSGFSRLKGWNVTSVDNGQKVIELYGETCFDMILMDVQMPVMSGLQATALIRSKEMQTHRHTPIVAMTAKALKGDREMCLNAGMDDFLSKPITVKDFHDVVERWIDTTG
jgi:signal transduction histidine kinase/ActR/RegA family two-component response regulator